MSKIRICISCTNTYFLLLAVFRYNCCVMKFWVQNTDAETTLIELNDTPFASGGEGALYEIKTVGFEQLVAKIYHVAKRTTLRHQKILYLHQHPPKAFDQDRGIDLIWPEQLLLDEQQEFVGFLMKKAIGEKLELLTLPKLARRYQEDWGHYDFAEDKRLYLRLQLCYKIAKAIEAIHATEQYILIDMKPDNIMVSPTGNIALVDLDSVEVVKDGVTVYDAPVATPEYTPADSYQDWDVDPTQEDPWDRFGLAVILYKVLLGIHPFAASTAAPYGHLTSISDKITNGFYVHNPEHRSHFETIPVLHEQFYSLPPNIQALFNRCFIEGYTEPFARPSAEEWSQELHEYHHRHIWKKRQVALPPIHLAYLPTNLSTQQFYKIPVTTIVSPKTASLVNQPISKAELKGKHLPTSVQDPKEITSQRFFNFMVLLLLVVVAAGVSIILPWFIAAVAAVVLYLGFNYVTYTTRKSAARKGTISSLFESQKGFLVSLLDQAKSYEASINEKINTLTQIQQKLPQQEFEDILIHKKMLLEKVSQFEQYLTRRKVELRKIKREEKNEYHKLSDYYAEQLKSQLQITSIVAPTPLQWIVLLKRKQRAKKLTTSETTYYEQDLATAEGLKLQLEIERTDLEEKYLERSKDILFSVQESHKNILEEIERYNALVTTQKEVKVKTLLEQQKISLDEIERLNYDVQRLEKPLEEQLATYRRAKIDVELYKKISYPRHLLEMVGILRPL